MAWLAHQIIVQIQTGSANDVAVVKRMAGNLSLKHAEITAEVV